MVFLTEVTLQAGVRRTSPAVNVPADVRSVNIELSSGNWDSKVGTGNIEFGIEYSEDGGTPWNVLAYAAGPIQARGKGVYLPTLNYSRATVLVGKVRAYVVSSISIRIGISGTIG